MKSREILSKLSYLYVGIMVGIFPLFYRNNYIDIRRAKQWLFDISSISFIIISLILIIIEYIEYRNSAKKKKNAYAIIWNSENIFMSIFIIAIIMSTLLSDYSKEAWDGSTGRGMGAKTILLCVCTCIIIGKYLKVSMGIVYIFIASNTLIFLIGIMNFFGLDILHMYDNLAEHQHNYFLTTIGNINVNSGYICLILPIAMTLYYLCEKNKFKILYVIFLIIGFFYGYITVSESWLLGIGASYLFLMIYSIRDYKHIKRWWELVGIFYCASLLMKISVLIANVLDVDTAMLNTFNNLKIQNLMIDGRVLFFVGVLLLVSFLFKNRIKNISTTQYVTWRKYSSVVLMLFFVVIIVLFIVSTVSNIHWIKQLEWMNIFRIDDSFGSNRGYIWKRTLISFWDLSFGQKVFGYGLGCFKQFIEAGYGLEIKVKYGASFIDAHNELLQFAVTTGLLGVIGYFGMLVSKMINSIKKSADKPILIVGAMVIISWIAQGMVNNPQIVLTPMMFIFLGILKSLDKS